MYRRPLLVLSFLLLALDLTAESPALTAIRAGTLLEPSTKTVRQNVVLVIENGRVREIADSVPTGADVIDLSGKVVMPGFIDGHTHVLLQGDATNVEYDEQVLGESLPYRALRASRAMRISLDHGFTTLRDIGNEGAGFADVDLKKAVANGVIQGPRLFVATKALTPTGAYGPAGWSWEIDLPKGTEMCDGADACRRAVRDQIAHGADWIKVYADRSYFKNDKGQFRSLPNFTLEELTAIVDQAHRTGRRVAAHSITPTGHALALAAGVDSIEHGDALDDASIAKMVEHGVFWCPTATVTDFVAAPRSATNPIWSDLQASLRDSFARARKAGVKIVIGTDAGGFPWDEINQAEEFRRYVAMGMTPWEALRAGTVVAADMLAQAGRLGTLAPGANADVIAMERNPLDDITATEHVVFVMKEGVVVKR